MTTLTNGTDTITPTQVDGWEASTQANTVVHVNLDASIDLSISADQPSAGSFVLVFAAEADAWEAKALLAQAGVWTIADDDVVSIGMQFVRQGTMTIALDDETRAVWVLTVGYQAVSS